MVKNKYSFTFDNWQVTHNQHRKYKRLISKTLKSLYPNRIEIEGFWYVPAQDFDNKGGYVSILNKAIGNITLFKSIVINYNICSFENLLAFIKNNKYDLFKSDGLYFSNTLQVLKISEIKGIKNEKKAIKYIKSYLKRKNITYQIKQSPLYSKLDIIEGIDIVLFINGREWYVQVKPLKSFLLKEDKYHIISSGKIKKYSNIHYYIFIDDTDCLFFANQNLEVINGNIIVSKNSLRN